MTIGSAEVSKSAESEHTQPDFEKLVACRKQVSAELNIPEDQIELSMGMSSDYLVAVSFM
jgi:hypothetical protein